MVKPGGSSERRGKRVRVWHGLQTKRGEIDPEDLLRVLSCGVSRDLASLDHIYTLPSRKVGILLHPHVREQIGSPLR